MKKARWLDHLLQHPLVRRPRAFYQRHERWAPALFFFGGVLWDALTLDRIDAWLDNVLLLTYLVLLGILLLVATLAANDRLSVAPLIRYRHWFPHAIQFFLGALYSAYVIFYFQSISISSGVLTPTAVFVGLLVFLLVANEFIHQRLFNLYLLFSLYFLAAFSFSIFFIPVITKTMNHAMFLLGGALSVAWVVGMLAYLRLRSVFASPRQFMIAVGLIVGLWGVLNLFYIKNWMPPVPLAMRFGGVFHEVERVGDAYALRYEDPAWYQFWVTSDTHFLYAQGEAVYCFSAIFAPTQLEQTIIHDWSFYDEPQKRWVTTDRVRYPIVGGRNQGYRGYSVKRNIRPGRWRVDVETEEGRLIGRIRFEIIPSETPSVLVERLYE